MLEAEQMVKSVCRSCHGGCGVRIYLIDDKAVRIEGDPEFPTNHGSLCSTTFITTQKGKGKVCKKFSGSRFVQQSSKKNKQEYDGGRDPKGDTINAFCGQGYVTQVFTE